MSKTTYWLGELIGGSRKGSVRIGGKKYTIGQPIPLNLVSTEKAAAWRKAGNIGDVKFTVEPKTAPGELDKLEDTIKKLSANVNASTSELAQRDQDLERSETVVAQLRESLDAAGVTVSEMEGAATAAIARISELEGLLETERERTTTVVTDFNALKEKVLALDSTAAAVVSLKAELNVD